MSEKYDYILLPESVFNLLVSWYVDEHLYNIQCSDSYVH
jgi:hypothetical protein